MTAETSIAAPAGFSRTSELSALPTAMPTGTARSTASNRRRSCDTDSRVVYAAISAGNIAEILADQGHLDESEALLREALATVRSAGFQIGVGFALSNLGRVALRRGDHEEAADLVYHLGVLMLARDFGWEDVAAKLSERHVGT